MKLRALVVDDELLARTALMRLLKRERISASLDNVVTVSRQSTPSGRAAPTSFFSMYRCLRWTDFR